ncbi:MAG TPA: MFS transporter [Gemmataceae bacterium]|jgi:MFS family permease|nr:MFS transporter [Gemmataceae bacterium]
MAEAEIDQGQVPDDIGSSNRASPESERKRKSALLIVFLVMFIDLLGFGIVLPLLPRYAKELIEPLFPGENNRLYRGLLLGLLMSSFSLMQFIFAPIWGFLSDRHGRRPFLLLGLAGSVIFYALFGIASAWAIPDQGREAIGLVLLFIARIGAGVAGATVSTAQAVIADSTEPAKRSRGMALIGAAFGIGFTFGPLIGTLSPYLGRGGPGYVASGFSLMAFILGLSLMPETLRPGQTGAIRSGRNFNDIVMAIRTPTIGLLILIFFISTFAFASFEPTVALVAQDILNYGEKKAYLVFAYIGLVLMLAQGGLYQLLAKRGMTEIAFMLFGIVFMMLGLGGIGLLVWGEAGNTSDVSDYLLPGIMVCVTLSVVGFAFTTPSVQALISKRSDPAKQGLILGVNQSANAVSRVLGPFFGGLLYVLSATHALPYALAVSLLIMGLILTLRVSRQ